MEQRHTISNGRLSVLVAGASARCLTYDGVEILRGLSAPVRDSTWGTCKTNIESESHSNNRYLAAFSQDNGLFTGKFEIALESENSFTAGIELSFARSARINRAGFCLLHPLEGVRGADLEIEHSDGTLETTRFPLLIAPSQPAYDIVGMRHTVGHVTVSIHMSGDVFEMEDQRNWSDASFKTYCRPLSLPHPFAVEAGDVIRQTVEIKATAASGAPMSARRSDDTTQIFLPQITLAFDPELCSVDTLKHFSGIPVLARVSVDTAPPVLEALAKCRSVALEIVFDRLDDIGVVAAKCARAGLKPIRVAAMPRAYLKSYQPDGEWPTGPKPDDAIPALRQHFPGIPVGGGSFTNFTEFNRCRPGADVDFLTFGNTAIVHAADDVSVLQTLEALPDMFATAKSVLPHKPLHLGLFSIGMRSNAYGDDVVPNPDGTPKPMARWDARQESEFAAAYAVGVLVEAGRAGVSSIALAMPDGELGAHARPIGLLIKPLAARGGETAKVAISDGLYVLHIGDQHVLANAAPEARRAPFDAEDIIAPGALLIMECGK